MSAANQLPAAMTVAEFLAWNPPGGDRWQLVDGTPHAMAPSTPQHGAIQAEAARLIGNHLAEQRPACRVITEAGIQPKVRAGINVRVHDIAVTCAAWNADDNLLRAPVVLVEILSPSNKEDTWANAWSYVTIPSVQEILVLHSTEIRADLLRRGEGGWPDDPAVIGPGGVVTLESLAFSAPLVAFYRTSGISHAPLAV
jgi:Uma2 family endonuclease